MFSIRFLTHSLLVLIFNSLQFLSASEGEPNPDLHLYLLVGQSNMAGRGVLDSLSTPNEKGVLMLN